MKCNKCHQGTLQKIRNATPAAHLICNNCHQTGTYQSFGIVEQSNVGLAGSPDDFSFKYQYKFNDALDPSMTLAVTGHQFNTGWSVANVWICRFGFWMKLIPEIRHKRPIELEMLTSACIKWLGDPLQRQWANADFRWGHAIKAVLTQIQKAQSA